VDAWDKGNGSAILSAAKGALGLNYVGGGHGLSLFLQTATKEETDFSNMVFSSRDGG